MTTAALLSAPPFLSAALVLALGSFVLIQNWREYLNRVFFSMCASLSLYNFGVGMMYLAADPAGAMSWAVVSLLGPALIICLLPHFSLSFLSLQDSPAARVMLFAFYLISALFIRLDLSGELVFKVHMSAIGYVTEPSGVYVYFALMIVTSIAYSVNVFAGVYRAERNEEIRLRIRHVIFGISVCAFLGLFDLIKKTAGVHQNFSTFEYGIAFFALMTSYSIIKHRLLKFEVAFSRGVLYSLMMLFVAVIFLVGSVITEQVTQSWLGSGSFAVNLFNAMAIAILFEPVRNWSQKLINRHLFPRIVPTVAVDELVLNNREIVEYLAHNRIDELKRIRTNLEAIIEEHERKNVR